MTICLIFNLKAVEIHLEFRVVRIVNICQAKSQVNKIVNKNIE